MLGCTWVTEDHWNTKISETKLSGTFPVEYPKPRSTCLCTLRDLYHEPAHNIIAWTKSYIILRAQRPSNPGVHNPRSPNKGSLQRSLTGALIDRDAAQRRKGCPRTGNGHDAHELRLKALSTLEDVAVGRLLAFLFRGVYELLYLGYFISYCWITSSWGPKVKIKGFGFNILGFRA